MHRAVPTEQHLSSPTASSFSADIHYLSIPVVLLLLHVHTDTFETSQLIGFLVLLSKFLPFAFPLPQAFCYYQFSLYASFMGCFLPRLLLLDAPCSIHPSYQAIYF